MKRYLILALVLSFLTACTASAGLVTSGSFRPVSSLPADCYFCGTSWDGPDQGVLFHLAGIQGLEVLTNTDGGPAGFYWSSLNTVFHLLSETSAYQDQNRFGVGPATIFQGSNIPGDQGYIASPNPVYFWFLSPKFPFINWSNTNSPQMALFRQVEPTVTHWTVCLEDLPGSVASGFSDRDCNDMIVQFDETTATITPDCIGCQPPVTTPEPASLFLLGAGLLSMRKLFGGRRQW